MQQMTTRHDGPERSRSRSEGRTIHARSGKCDACGNMFATGEIILWNINTKLTLHPDCCPGGVSGFERTRNLVRVLV